MDSGFTPSTPRKYKILMDKLQSCREEFPRVYQEKFVDPFIEFLENIGAPTIDFYLNVYGEECTPALISRPILQRCSFSDQIVATDAFQEVISDLYDGFLSEEDRAEIKLPDYCVVAPLVSWIPSWTRENSNIVPNGPCTNPADWLRRDFGIETAIVNLPVQYGRHGLFAWATLGHECAGHDILSADEGLIDELRNTVKNALLSENIDPYLADYWNFCIEETASDVMGILNMGPSVGIATLGYFRALNAALDKKREFKLWNLGIAGDNHPADILRGYLAADVVRQLKFNNAKSWADAIEKETEKDLGEIRLEANRRDPDSGKIIGTDEAKKSVEIVARNIVNAKMKALEDHSLGEIQNWRDHDEDIVNELSSSLTMLSPISDIYIEGIYAAHVVAAAVVASLEENANIDLIFKGMLSILKLMHDENPVWKLPIYLEHPGDIDFAGRIRYQGQLYRRYR